MHTKKNNPCIESHRVSERETQREERQREKNFVKFALSACYLIQQTYINPLDSMQQVNLTICCFMFFFSSATSFPMELKLFIRDNETFNYYSNCWVIESDFILIRCWINVNAYHHNDHLKLILMIKRNAKLNSLEHLWHILGDIHTHSAECCVNRIM